MNKIQIENLNLFYGNFHALKNVELDIKDKEITELHGFKEVLDNDAVVIATQSFKEGFNWAMNYKDSSEYQNIFIVFAF